MGSNEFIRVKVEGISQLEKMRAFLDPNCFKKQQEQASWLLPLPLISRQVRVLAKDITLDQGVLNRM